MKPSGESNRFYLMLAISIALNLFLLPVIAGSWFWSSRLDRSAVEALHPAEVKTVTLHTPKKPPPPKPKPQPKPKPLPAKMMKPLPAPRQAAVKPKTVATPHPHVLAQSSGGNSAETGTVSQGTGPAGTPTLPTAPPSPPPPPPAPPKPVGESRGAVATFSPSPEIPDSLKSDVLKAYVRVRFTISADGRFEVKLLTSSGSPELDQLTLQKLNQWRWKPALQNGIPIPSVEQFRVEYTVE